VPASQSQSDPNLLIEVARLYYEQQLTQSEIGRQINVSRSTVSRLLQEARDLGIVTITIDYNVARDRSLEQQLQKWFDLKDVRVLRSYGRTNGAVGSAFIGTRRYGR
jgi:DNA-binding transcriptional regulator LsrR (DeoR family)